MILFRFNDIDFPYTVIEKDEKLNYDEMTDTFTIRGINEKKNKDKVTLKTTKFKSFEATLMLNQTDTHKIYEAKEQKESITLELKIGKDTNNEIKEATVIKVL